MKRKSFIFDLETTGLDVRTADILQLGGIYLEDNDGAISLVEPVNLYFSTDDEVPPNASRVNHLTRIELNRLSKGLYFEDSYKLYKKYFEDPDVIAVGYNILGYDKPVLLSNCERTGVPKPQCGALR